MGRAVKPGRLSWGELVQTAVGVTAAGLGLCLMNPLWLLVVFGIALSENAQRQARQRGELAE